LDNAVDAVYARAVKVFQEMMQLEKKQLKDMVLAHLEESGFIFLCFACCY